MTHTCLAVIKVGGSLFDWPGLPGRLEAFLAAHFPKGGIERPILLAGGGPAADLVREFDRVHRLGDETAHHLALHAMELSARLLSVVIPGATLIDCLESVEGILASGCVPVLAPIRTIAAIDENRFDPLPRNWAVTSDSIAARIAAHVKASRLILLKSMSIARHATRHEAAHIGFVDPFFPEAARGLDRVEYLNLREPTEPLQVLGP